MINRIWYDQRKTGDSRKSRRLSPLFSFLLTREMLLEASFLQGGLTAVGDLAKTRHAQQPLGYLYWLQQLEDEERWTLLRDAGSEVLDALANGRDRRKAAEYLIKAGKKLHRDETILVGYLERFRSNRCQGLRAL